MRPSISVLISVRKPDHYLDQAVNSSLGDLGEEDEVVVVIDGPSGVPIGPWVADPRVRVIPLMEHCGTPTALNRGLDLCRFDYVLRLDADDIAVVGRSDRLVAALEADARLVAVGSCATLISSEGAVIGQLHYPSSAIAVTHGLLRRNQLIHSSVMYRKAAVFAVGGYDARCIRMQDYDLFLRLARVGLLANLPELLVKYRVHPNQAS